MDDKDNVTVDEYWNPDGSHTTTEGVASPDRHILGEMAHSGRRGEAVAINIYGEQDVKTLGSGV